MFSCSWLGVIAQQNTEMGLSAALVEVAAYHKISIIFNPKKIGSQTTFLPNETWTLNKKLNYLLRATDFQYEITEDQIFLYQQHQIYGYIEDSQSGERLISATVYIPSSGQYSITNEYGYFTLTTIKESIDIEVSYIGYESQVMTISEDQMDRPRVLTLTPDNEVTAIVISDALIAPEQRKYIEYNKGTDVLLFQNQASSAVGGEPDIFQAIIRQSGVNTGADGVGGIHVRGGKNDQNQILYDGVRLYNSAHAFGVYSIINNSVIDQARLHKSGASGALSGRLSSIIDIKTKDPNLKELGATAQVSTLASQATMDIPIIKNRVGVMLSGRRTHIDPILKSISRDDKALKGEDGNSNFYFDDYSLKAYAKINNRQKLYLSLYSASDNYTDQHYYEEFNFGEFYRSIESFELDWSSRLASLRYNVLLGDRTFVNFKLSTYQYKYGYYYFLDAETTVDPGVTFYSPFLKDFESGITSHELRIDFQTQADQHELKYGIVASNKDYHTGTLYREDELDDDTLPPPIPLPILEFLIGRFTATDLTMYLTDKFKLKPNLIVNAGIYANYYEADDDLDPDSLPSSFKSIFGYLKTTSILNDQWSIGFSVGTFVQNEHLLTTGDNGYPSDIWLPSTDGLAPERSNQAEIFMDYNDNGHRVKASIYYKVQQGLIIFDTIAVLPSVTVLESDLWQEQTVSADNRSYGFELDYSYSFGDKYSLRSMYSYAVSDYVFKSEGFEDFIYPFEFSIPHTINIGVNAQLSTRIRMMLDWYYATGRPYTLYTSPIPYTPLEKDSDIEVIQVSGYNELRLPSTHKLSIALSGYWYWGDTRNDISLGIQNVYNRRNILYEYELVDEGIRSQQGFPLLPMLRWRVSL